MKNIAVIIHWGPVGPTVKLAVELNKSTLVNQVTIVANDLSERPNDIPDEISWIVPARNLGFAGGFLHATDIYPAASCYLLLNNDIELAEVTIKECLELLSRDDVGVVGPTLVNARGLQSGAAVLTRFLAAPRVLRTPRLAQPCEAEWVTGAVMFIKAECHQSVPMDGRYFLGFEDADFCHRARDAGWRVMLSPAHAWHASGGTIPAGRYVYYSVRNRLWFVRMRGWRLRTVLVVLWSALVLLPTIVMKDLLRRRGYLYSSLAFHGLIDGLWRLPTVNTPLPDEPRPARWASWA
ncbi:MULTISPECIES: glycosyltransferase family 2 protein [unclassified Frankia]|uniref:glycosyltransferase family 2 protein n=1 Tax=unclassified Frankia TaxID=2632575 RepID=UPI001EF4A98B|nr:MULTISPECIES: glycosyltransferase family 2 protein [unclassified Frankia]